MKTNNFVFPLKLGKESIKRLLVASIKGDPGYAEIEPQLFDDPETGKGLRILMYRKDRKVDVYWQRGIHFDIQNFTRGDGPGYAGETIMSPARFEMTRNGVDIDIAFTDKLGRHVAMVIKENNPNGILFHFLLR